MNSSEKKHYVCVKDYYWISTQQSVMGNILHTSVGTFTSLGFLLFSIFNTEDSLSSNSGKLTRSELADTYGSGTDFYLSNLRNFLENSFIFVIYMLLYASGNLT